MLQFFLKSKGYIMIKKVEKLRMCLILIWFIMWIKIPSMQTNLIPGCLDMVQSSSRVFCVTNAQTQT